MLDADLRAWLDEHAGTLDTSCDLAEHVLPRLAAAGLYRLGVPVRWGGSGDSVAAAMQAIAELASHSLTAAFVCWGQRAFIEYLLHSDNSELRERWLPALLAGERAGATGLSNAIKFLSGLEGLQVAAQPTAAGYALSGRLPWVTNLRKRGFLVACAVAHSDAPPSIFAVPHESAGLRRSDDLDLIALRGSNTAALSLQAVELAATWRLHADAGSFLRAVRPAFLGLQCGLSYGLANAALRSSRQLQGTGRDVLAEPSATLQAQLDAIWQQLGQGVCSGEYVRAPRQLFEQRIALAELASAAVQLELQASGGKAYLRADERGFARRWREAAFVPIVTPSLVQLKAELAAASGTHGSAQ
jgi:alkylation response protein AidB-like acyl-CoA dehydrogenase